MKIEQKYATLPEAARYAGVSERTLRRYIDQGRLTGYRLGPRQIRIDLAEVDAMFIAIPVEANEPQP